eukprot:IDg22396t1
MNQNENRMARNIGNASSVPVSTRGMEEVMGQIASQTQREKCIPAHRNTEYATAQHKNSGKAHFRAPIPSSSALAKPQYTDMPILPLQNMLPAGIQLPAATVPSNSLSAKCFPPMRRIQKRRGGRSLGTNSRTGSSNPGQAQPR